MKIVLLIIAVVLLVKLAFITAKVHGKNPK